MRRLAILALILAAGAAAVARTLVAPPPPAMTAAAREFLASLSPEQKQKAQLPFDADERFNWFYTPVARKGLPLKEMTDVQRRAAAGLLRAGLSEQGHSKAETIRALEDVLVELGGNPRVRDKELYFFTIFGEPGPQSSWGWRYEGHHLSQNWTIVNGKALATTPQFFGANPAEVRQGAKKGQRALAAEEDIAIALVNSLDSYQRRDAVIDANAPNDILTTNTREAAIQADLGVSHAQLRGDQRALLMRLIETHAGAQAPDVAAARLAKLKDGLHLVKFAWMGALGRGAGHYYRIQGPTFLIEFDNTQNDANHIHTVWRDFKGDWGRDLLADHYKTAPHHAR